MLPCATYKLVLSVFLIECTPQESGFESIFLGARAVLSFYPCDDFSAPVGKYYRLEYEFTAVPGTKDAVIYLDDTRPRTFAKIDNVAICPGWGLWW